MGNGRKLRPARGSTSLKRTIETKELPNFLQCKFFGGDVKPEDNHICSTVGKFREYGLVFCDLHYQAMNMDPKDWTDEMMGY